MKTKTRNLALAMAMALSNWAIAADHAAPSVPADEALSRLKAGK